MLAERLEAFAALLELNSSSFYTTRAYRRAAELIRSMPADVSTIVRSGRVRELRGIGPGIETRLRELVETGELAELRELEAEVMPELVAVGRLIGLSPVRMRELGSALEVRTLGHSGRGSLPAGSRAYGESARRRLPRSARACPGSATMSGRVMG